MTAFSWVLLMHKYLQLKNLFVILLDFSASVRCVTFRRQGWFRLWCGVGGLGNSCRFFLSRQWNQILWKGKERKFILCSPFLANCDCGWLIWTMFHWDLCVHFTHFWTHAAEQAYRVLKTSFQVKDVILVFTLVVNFMSHLSFSLGQTTGLLTLDQSRLSTMVCLLLERSVYKHGEVNNFLIVW